MGDKLNNTPWLPPQAARAAPVLLDVRSTSPLNLCNSSGGRRTILSQDVIQCSDDGGWYSSVTHRSEISNTLIYQHMIHNIFFLNKLFSEPVVLLKIKFGRMLLFITIYIWLKVFISFWITAGKQCMGLVDLDRSWAAETHGYSVQVMTMEPESCSPKNNMLVGRPLQKIQLTGNTNA